MALEPFTTADEVRAALGVSSEELSNETLALPLYELGLKAELNALGATLVADFLVVQAIDPPGDRTALQAAFYDAVRAFSPHCVALPIFPRLPMIALKSITDGKAGVSRSSTIDYGALTAAAMNTYSTMRLALQQAYAAFKGTPAPTAPLYPSLMTTARGTDPVTGV